MEDSLKKDFQRRLSQCNKGELVVIMFDIVRVYLDDAKGAEDYPEFKGNVQKAMRGLEELMGALDFSYELSKDLFRVYKAAQNRLALTIVQNRKEGIEEAERILMPVYTSFCQVAKQDGSAPIMGNTQQVYAGMTYGRNSLNENCTGEYNRGFLA